MTDGDSLIQLRGLSRVYRSDQIETTALDSINLEIQDGEFVAIRGPSGCGKSTLLNIAGLLDRPSGGSYFFRGEDVGSGSDDRLAEIRCRQMGFVFQSFHLLDELSVRENVEFGLLFHSLTRAARRSRADEVMERMAIAHRATHKPRQLSGGQQQRVAVARAIVGKPDLILADEPTGNLDSENGRQVMELLTELNRNGVTILMVTHSLAHAGYARRDLQLHDGRIVTEPSRKIS